MSSDPASTPAPTKPEKPKSRNVSDPEVIAMHEIVEILIDLEEPVRGRVVAWASERFKDDRPF